MQPATNTGPPAPELITALLRQQAPEFALLPPVRTRSSGSSNWVFRLGDTHAVRLPRSDDYVSDLLTEVRWLPRLGPALPLAVPEICHAGAPSELFPRPWAVVTWIDGAEPVDLGPAEQLRLASTLGDFVARLHAVDLPEFTDGEQQWGYRSGEPVTDAIDAWVRDAARDLADLFEPQRVLDAWQLLRDVPPATQPACWIHTDLSAENLLVDPAGNLVGVIDFGALGVGDRSVDLLYAWELFDPPARAVLRAAAGFDDASWLRARAWAFAGPGVVTIADYRETMPARTARLIRMVETVAAEVGVALR